MKTRRRLQETVTPQSFATKEIFQMKGFVFEGDPTDHGGYVMTATSTIIEGGKRAALVGDLVSCPREGHGVTPIIEGDPTMMSDGKSLVTHLSRAGCGCRIFAKHSTLLAG